MTATAPVFVLEPVPGLQGAAAVRGALCFATAAQAFAALEAALAQRTLDTLDLSGVTQGDSAGLACLLAARGDAKRLGRPFAITHLPDGMRALAAVCGVDGLLA